MSASGTWNLTMQTPMGDYHATLVAKAEGGTLSGTQSAEGNSSNIFEGTVSGNAVSWKVDTTQPMPMTLEYSGNVEGDKISGNMKAGAFGTFPFSGTRA